MKNQFLIILTLLLGFNVQSQKDPLMEDMRIEIINTEVKNKWEFGKDTNNLEERYLVGFTAKVYDCSTRQMIDFNNLSLVDKNNKTRYLAFQIGFPNVSYTVNQTRMEDFKGEDNFLKYSQNGIENFKQYRTYYYSDRGKNNSEHRFDIDSFSPAKKKGFRKFYFLFPALKSKKDSGEYLIYWKDKLIGEFKIVNGMPQ